MDIHVTHFGSACIFECNADYPLDGPGFSERDPPNFAGSFYSHSKMVSEKAIQAYPNVCILRLRQPIAADLHYRNFVSKLIGYQKLVSIPNVRLLCLLLYLTMLMGRIVRVNFDKFAPWRYITLAA